MAKFIPWILEVKKGMEAFYLYRCSAFPAEIVKMIDEYLPSGAKVETSPHERLVGVPHPHEMVKFGPILMHGYDVICSSIGTRGKSAVTIMPGDDNLIVDDNTTKMHTSHISVFVFNVELCDRQLIIWFIDNNAVFYLYYCCDGHVLARRDGLHECIYDESDEIIVVPDMASCRIEDTCMSTLTIGHKKVINTAWYTLSFLSYSETKRCLRQPLICELAETKKRRSRIKRDIRHNYEDDSSIMLIVKLMNIQAELEEQIASLERHIDFAT